MADYESGEVTDRERGAAKNLKDIAYFNADNTKRQLVNQRANYDMADEQNWALADMQMQQNARKADNDRFDAQRDLQNAAMGLLGSMGTALNGSSTNTFLDMLSDRNDKNNSTYWNQQQTNNDQVTNAYDESVASNRVARNDAGNNAQKALKDMEGELSANLNNINPNLYEAPSEGGAYLDSESSVLDDVPGYYPKMSGYLMPDNAVGNARDDYARNHLSDKNYYGRLVNKANQR